MKVTIINTWEQKGGAAVAASRLMHALNKSGIEATMLVRDKQSNNKHVVASNTSWLSKKINFVRFAWERLIILLNNGWNRSAVFQVSIANTGTDISNHPIIREADIIHLHWINQGFLSLEDIKKLAQLGKPIVWTMHDMWPFTGICHYAGGCENYKTTCGNCILLQSDKMNDLSNKIFRNKKGILIDSGVTFVGCSKWIADNALNSSLTTGHDVMSIPNAIDTTVYKPINEIQARTNLKLPQDKNLLLFGAANISDPRKGLNLFLEALYIIKKRNPDLAEKLNVVTFGKIDCDIIARFPVLVKPMGFMTDEEQIVKLYNAADIYIIPSLEDNLPNTIMESMACGLPCVGFATGGIPEMIDHKVNGYVTRYKDAADLAQGIEWVLTNKDLLHLQDECVKKVQSSYTEQVVAREYISLYKKLLAR